LERVGSGNAALSFALRAIPRCDRTFETAKLAASERDLSFDLTNVVFILSVDIRLSGGVCEQRRPARAVGFRANRDELTLFGGLCLDLAAQCGLGGLRVGGTQAEHNR